jgi:hypothetical protein
MPEKCTFVSCNEEISAVALIPWFEVLPYQFPCLRTGAPSLLASHGDALFLPQQAIKKKSLGQSLATPATSQKEAQTELTCPESI